MSDTPNPSSSEPLQFDRAVHADAAAEQAPLPTISCSKCKAQVRSYYYHVDGESVCAKCKQEVERASGGTRSGGAWMRAAAYGLAASVLGAAIYYGVIALFNLEIGIVAILIGFMVGAAVRAGAKGGGGRRYQILAAGLTYLSVGMAYAPVAYKGFVQARSDKIAARAARADSTRAVSASSDDEADDDAAADANAAADSVTGPEVQRADASALPDKSVKKLGAGVILLGLGATLLIIFVLPVMVVLGTLPSGIISALIIGFGIRQAWRMTDGTTLTITGPYKVGAPAAAPATAA